MSYVEAKIKELDRIDALAQQLDSKAEQKPAPTLRAPDNKQGRGPSQATKIIALTEGLDLFNDGENGFVNLEINGHRETHPLRSRGFRDYLSRSFYLMHKGAPSAQATEEALRVLDGKARFEGERRRVHLRVAEHDGVIYLDLADDKWRAVEITAGGWRIVERSPAHFIRKPGMRPLPAPECGGSLADLRQFLNAGSDEDFILTCAWLLGAMMPSGPYVILNLEGEQGSAKSTNSRVLRALIDPHVMPLRLAPRDENDIIIAASNGWIVALDNLSGLSAHLSDAICVVATGGGLGKRQLYSDSDETLLNVTRPILLNGIDQIASRGDLADRTIVLELPVIPDNRRLPEAQFWKSFEKIQPRLLGALLDAVSVALRNRPYTVLKTAPRMADFAHWVVAAEPALPWTAGVFLTAYNDNRRRMASVMMENPLVGAIQELLVNGPWSGTASKLLDEINVKASEAARRSKHWPAAGNVLSGRLKRLAPVCRRVGVEIRFSDGHHPRIIRLERVGETSSQPSQVQKTRDGWDDEIPGSSMLTRMRV